MICAPLRVSWAPAWNRMNDLVDARHVDARWDGPGQVIHSGLLKVWRLDLAVRSSLPAVSGATWVDLAFLGRQAVYGHIAECSYSLPGVGVRSPTRRGGAGG